MKRHNNRSSITCEQCGKSNAVLVELTNPRDYSVTSLLLCGRCRDKRGVKPPTHLIANAPLRGSASGAIGAASGGGGE